MSCFSLLLFCCYFFIARSDHSPAHAASYHHQQQSLLAFKSSIDFDPYHSLDNWTTLIPICNWTGITCHVSQDRLLSLNLSHMALQGSISPHLANISSLLSIDLSGNALHGYIPSQLENLSQLKYLSLRGNQLGGAIPLPLGKLSALVHLDLGHNRIAGHIPIQVANLTNLAFLDLSSNHFNGTLPSFTRLQNLERLFLQKNMFVGTIPDDIGQLKNVRLLKISHNNLTGRIPQSMGNMRRLKRLFLHHNHLSDMIPDSLGYCRNLQLLDLSHNSLIGSIPQEVANLSGIKFYLNLSYNYLQGFVPEEMGRLVRAQAIDISRNLLNGIIPETFGNCTAMKYLNLSRNGLQGSIPDSLGNLQNLSYLDLSLNSLSGTVPMSVKKLKLLRYLNLSFNSLAGDMDKGGSFENGTAVISFVGNVGLCGSSVSSLPACGRQKSHFTTLKALGAVSAFIFLLHLLLIGYLYRKRFCLSAQAVVEIPLRVGVPKISYEEVVIATDGFNDANLLARSNFGSVYKGILSNDTIVAVKVFKVRTNDARDEALKSFQAECKVLKQVRHRNLGKIVSICTSGNFKALVFEFMCNESLEKHLYPDGDLVCQLGLMERLNTAIDIADAIEYLHHNCPVKVVHCDIKPSNVLFDEDMTAHLTDFGIARIMDRISPDSVNLKGSVGYIAPEYGLSGRVSTRGDVYSFGILLLEMLTGKRPTDDMFERGLTLHKWVNMAFLSDVLDVVDKGLPRCPFGIDSQVLISLFRIGLWSSKDTPEARPTMSQVSGLLKICRNDLLRGSSFVASPTFEELLSKLLEMHPCSDQI